MPLDLVDALAKSLQWFDGSAEVPTQLVKLGFDPKPLEDFMWAIHQPWGMVLVTGPTGSGKTTTLYSALKTIATRELNVTTIEDPIEMVHEDFNQTSVQLKVVVQYRITACDSCRSIRSRMAPFTRSTARPAK